MDKRFEEFFGMKQIEGQTLLSIHQYFPTDYLRMAKKSQGMMNLFIENISEKVKKGIMDFNLDSPSLEIKDQAQPPFTLTAEEVGVIKRAIKAYDSLILRDNKRFPALINAEQMTVNKILTRIKDFQDEQNKSNMENPMV